MIRRLLTAFAALCVAIAPGAQAEAQLIVHDPINGVTLIDQKINQMKQIANQIQQLRNELRNLTPYSTSWSDVIAQVAALRAKIVRSAPTIDNANAQLAQMSDELSTLHELQAMSNGSQGALQVSQTTNSLLATLITQVQKQRALTINAIEEEEQNRKDAYAALYGPSRLPK